MARLLIAPDGSVRTIYSDAIAPLLGALGCVDIRRASHVEPADGGGWEANLSPVGGPLLGSFPLRAEALAAEVDWLKGAGLPIPRREAV